MPKEKQVFKIPKKRMEKYANELQWISEKGIEKAIEMFKILKSNRSYVLCKWSDLWWSCVLGDEEGAIKSLTVNLAGVLNNRYLKRKTNRNNNAYKLKDKVVKILKEPYSTLKEAMKANKKIVKLLDEDDCYSFWYGKVTQFGWVYGYYHTNN